MLSLRVLWPTTMATLLLFASDSSAQDSSSTPQPPKSSASATRETTPQTGTGPTIRIASNLVVVDVVVSDDGKPVKGLQREAFHIFEGGL